MLTTMTMIAYLLGNAPAAGANGGTFQLMSPAFRNGTAIPQMYTCKGKDIPIPLRWKGVPSDAKSLVLVMRDVDAPGGTWYHWTLYDISPKLKQLRSSSKLDKGEYIAHNSWGNAKYQGPCPPKGIHRYVFQLYALNRRIRYEPGTTTSQVINSMQGHILGRAQLFGRVSADQPQLATKEHRKKIR